MQIDTQSSLVSQFIIGVDSNFSSEKLQFSLSGTESLVGYSHESQLNDDYQTLQANSTYKIWDNKLQAIFSSSITNVSNNDSNNSLADLVSGDTIQQINNSAGLQYNNANSDYSLSSVFTYNVVNTEDNIGESNGYIALINSENGNAARAIFWQVNGSFSHQENNLFNNESYQFETKIGAITTYKINPFIRFYNEKVSGSTAGNNPDAIPSWGPGLRYQAASNFIIDLSYNYVDDTEVSDNYLSADIDWQPSARTSIKANYSKRFFGDSYALDFSHRTKKLTNTVSYDETIEVFDRNNFTTIDNIIWCPNGAFELTDCLPLGEIPTNTNDYQNITISALELIESNEFSLNKRLSWLSTLAFTRTTFTLDISSRERESLTSDIIDNYITARFSVSRRISTRSSVTVFADYRDNTFDKDRPDGPRQEDTYKTFSANYTRSLASSLNAFLTLQFIDRQSNIERFIYNEARVSINLTKDF